LFVLNYFGDDKNIQCNYINLLYTSKITLINKILFY